MDWFLSQAQSQNFDILPPQPEVSFCRTSIASSGTDLSWYPHLQGASHVSANMLSEINYSQTQIPVMQSTAASNSILSEKSNASYSKVCTFNGSSVLRNAFQENSLFSKVPTLASTDGILQSNRDQAYALQRNTSVEESGMTQGKPRCPLNSRRTPDSDPILGKSSLDPLEKEILFNTGENSWESATRQGTTGVGCSQSTLGHVDFMGSYSSNQSGSWSALMQSAVSEASSSATGQQEEWSGSTLQNTELSSDSQPTNFIDCGKLQSCWIDNNLQCVSSPTLKPDPSTNPDMDHSFPGFQESSYQTGEHREGMQSDSFYVSVQQRPNNPHMDCNFPGFQQQDYHRGQKPKRWMQKSTPQTIIERGQRISVQVHSSDIRSNLRAADVSPKNISDYSLVDTSADFSSRSTADASQENSEGDRNGGHSGSGGSNPSSYLSCIEDLDNQLYYNNSSASQGLGIKLSPPFQLTSKSFSSIDSPYLVNTSPAFSSGPSYKGDHLINPHLLVTTVGNASPAIAHSAISGTLQQVGLSVWRPKMAAAPTSRQYLWQSEVPLGSLNSLPSLDTGRQISGCQSVGQLQSGTSMQVALKAMSPLHLRASDDRVRLRHKKRKGVALDLLPCHIEVASGPCKLQTVSCLAESEWVLASNRSSEKMEKEAEINHDVVLVPRATKRLRLTTQLLQQLIRPAPVAILSADARLNGESVVFFVCRLALGDACSLTSDSHLNPLASDKSLHKYRTSDTIGKQDFLENFNKRAKRLESDLLRLEKLSSITETKVEIQELEKFSIISRFARFHRRGNNASSDSGATPALLKPSPQRYVVAHPMPKILPEETKCLSL